MREIKFRAWIRKNEVMLKDATELFQDNWTNPFTDNDYICMQYTGLKDKNDKEIYEGDIVKAYKSNSSLNGNYPVVWDEQRGRWCYGPIAKYGKIHQYQVGSSGNTTCEILGNIYENPKLIK